MSHHWTSDDIGDLSGQRVLITGVTGGLGLETAKELARHRADLLVTARNADKADEAVAEIVTAAPQAQVDVIDLDLADLASVGRAAHEIGQRTQQIDILINNAGIMIPPERMTVDGYELQIATNHLGHFALTAHLWPILAASQARVVSVSSLAHTLVHGIDLDSLTAEGAQRTYRRWTSYGESKLANLLFARELDRRASAGSLGVVSVAAHPGIASTQLTKTGWGIGGNGLIGTAMHQGTRVLAQSARAGAQPTLMAATYKPLTGGEYIGPQGIRGFRGHPGPARMSRVARDQQLAARLWEASEKAARLDFTIAG